MSTRPQRRISTATYEAVYSGADFIELDRRLRSFAVPATVFFLCWYLLYVLLTAFAPDFMAIELFGNINVALVIGLLQFVSTFAITAGYWRWSERHLDPLAASIRQGIEEATR